MKQLSKFIFFILIMFILIGFSGCSSQMQNTLYVTSIEQTIGNQENIYTVYYSDGTTSTFTVSNGSEKNEETDVTIDDLYEKYVIEYGDISYSDFLELYFSNKDILNMDNSYAIAKCLLSSLKIYSEFIETTTINIRPGQTYTSSDTVLSTGSGVIWSIDEDEDGYTYLVTNYHVVYDASADTSKNGGVKTARKMHCYLYGSESSPVGTNETDSEGYTVYDYGSYAVECEYVGGSITSDIAVLRTKTSSLKEINPYIQEVTLADNYYVGQAAVAIGNPEGEGISVTQGIVSVENEYITLNIDGTSRNYRSIRIDTALYSGNSGGGLYNSEGELIGITNAGDTSDQNINYAVPLEIVKGTVENILYYYTDCDDSTNGAYKITIGITVQTQNSKYVYDQNLGYGNIIEEVVISSVSEKSIAETLGLEFGDIVKRIIINNTEYIIERSFHISDIILTMHMGDSIQIVCQRNDEQYITNTYVLVVSDFIKI